MAQCAHSGARRQWLCPRRSDGLVRRERCTFCPWVGQERPADCRDQGRARRSRRTDKPARRFKQFQWTTRKSWSRERRVVAKAEWTQGEANPRFIVTSLMRGECKARHLYEKV